MKGNRRNGIGWLLCFLGGASAAWAADPRPETLEAWRRYLELTEARIARELGSNPRFLVQDYLPPAEKNRIQQTIASGGIDVRKMETRDEEGRPIDVPGGMIHHWYGATFVPKVALPEVVGWVQRYSDHQRFYEEVVESRLLSREGDVFSIFLKLRRKKILTVFFNTEHRVAYRNHGNGRVSSRSEATRIAELDHPETDQEREKPPGKDRGFLWRLNSYWRFQERDGGVVVECESVSLSRGIPPGMAWLVRSFVESVPEESLRGALAPMSRISETR